MRQSVSLIGLCFLLLLGARPSSATAEENPFKCREDLKPFKGRVTATWDNVFNGLYNPPANFKGGGPVTHMGITTQTGTLFLGPPDADGILPGYGSVTITAADGDKLYFDYKGLLDSTTGKGAGTIVFTGGTGRFAEATGTGTFAALIDLSVPVNQSMTVLLDGKIDY